MRLPSVCVHQGCETNSLPPEKQGQMFCFPRNNELRSKWIIRMNRNDLHIFSYNQLLDRGHRVCRLHFADNQFQTFEKKRLNRGEIPRNAKPVSRLNTDKVLVAKAQVSREIVHPETPSSSKKRPPDPDNYIIIEEITSTSRKRKVVDVGSNSDDVLVTNTQISKKVKHSETPSDTNQRPLPFRVLKELPSTSHKTEEINISKIFTKIESKPHGPTPRDSVAPEETSINAIADIKELNTFEEIWNGGVKLPSEFWSMAKVSHSTRSVLFSTFVILAAGPIEEKQLVIKEDLQLECYVYRRRYEVKEVFPPMVTSVQHVEELLRTLDNRTVCQEDGARCPHCSQLLSAS